jgi:hypothetical protein
MNKEEYVPTTTPSRIAKIKPRKTSPPKTKMISNTIIVVADVLKVLLKVEFNALSITLCLVSSFDWRLKNSLILSKRKW